MEMIRRKIWMAVCAVMVCAAAWGQKAVTDAFEQFQRADGSWHKAPNTVDGNEQTFHSLDRTTADQSNYASGTNNRLGYIFSDAKVNNIGWIVIVANGEEATRPTSVVVKIRQNSNSNENWIQVGEYNCTGERTVIENIDWNSIYNVASYQQILLVFKNNRGGQGTTDIYEVYFYTTPSTYKQGNQYNNDYQSESIQHKHPKWYELRGNLSEASKDLDTFDDGRDWFTDSEFGNGNKIQAAHTYIDTLYVHKGQNYELALPTISRNKDSNSARKYQRWYNYRTDRTFRTKNNGSSECWDLLSPSFNNANYTAYRFTNGYVGGHSLIGNSSLMYGASFYYPTDEEFEDWKIDNGRGGNNAYIIACDISGYNDFTETFDVNTSHTSSFNPNFYEPTIQLRVIYFIIGVDDMDEDITGTDFWEEGYGRLFNDTDYQGGYGEGKKFLEEYNITFPADHISDYTDELVALSKSARNYRIPDKPYDGESLSVSLATNDAGLRLVSNTISGDSRVISFRESSMNDKGRWSVDDNSTATIVVTKTVDGITYNIAKYNLTFKEESRLLTQHQLDLIDNNKATGKEWNYTHRTPQYLEEHYQLLTSRTFDYDPDVANEYGQSQKEYYPFPLNWDYSSYAFFDGSGNQDFDKSTTHGAYNNNPFAEWGSYCIVNDYMGYDDKVNHSESNPNPDPTLGGRGLSATNNSKYFLYVDASDLPGTVVTLPFEENLCRGTELFVSAWGKSCSNSTGDDAAILFTIYGIRKDGSKKALYSYSTGQIRKTTHIATDNDYTKDYGFGIGTNDWFHLYFSFINDDVDDSIVSYELKVDNNSASTNGGDFYLDDLKIYIARPVPVVTQREYTCVDERTLMSAYLDWGQLTERLGMEENSMGTNAIDFCFIDKAAYEAALNNNSEDIEGAIRASIQKIGDGESLDEEIVTLFFHENFESNKEYDPKAINLIVGNKEEDGNYYFYRTGTGATRRLITDFYATLSPYRQYEMLIIDHSGTQATFANFAAVMNNPCGIRSEFYVQPQTLMKVNGEIVDPNQDFCEGQIFNFTAQVRVPTGTDSEGNETYTILNDVNFDWFFGTEDDFIQENEDYGGVSLNEALAAFREIPEYRDKENLDGVVAQGDAFTQNHIDIIKHYLEAEGEVGGLQRRLILCKPNLDVAILKTGLQLVIRPIPIFRPNEIAEDASWDKVCWNYVQLSLKASKEAPVLHAGFNRLQYPSADFNPSIRLGLEQIEKASGGSNTITIDLRGAEYASEGVTHLGLIESATDKEMYQKIYLLDSDDPQYENILDNENLSGEYSLPIGRITELHAEEYTTTSDYNDYAKIQFNLSSQTLENGTTFRFIPREGYSYTFAINYEEKGAEEYNTCWGKFPVTMKVVPEYLVWDDKTTEAGKIGNWNNDENWRRAKNSELKKTGTTEYPTEGNTSGFVPMLFSKVIMPEDSEAELYMAGFNNDGNWIGTSTGATRPENVEDPTSDIQYDLMVFEHDATTNPSYNGKLKTERFRVNICDQIHFMDGSQMLHPEHLVYNTAWVDYKLKGGDWHLLASPLRGVVAGDFYTDNGGTEEQEYFTQIKWEDTNSRLSPSVYQRAWNNAAQLTLSGGQTKSVAIQGNWSSVYNNVYESNEPGQGFSLKVQDLDATDGNAVFRLPKDDPSYSYFSHEGGSGTTATGFTRDSKNGTLVSNIFSTREEYKDDKINNSKYAITVELDRQPDNGKYYLVGNPFMSHLDMVKFFTENEDVLLPKYWTVDNGIQNIAIVKDDDANWVSTTGTSVNTIAPLRSFFVQKAETASATATIKFTADMQTLAESTTGTSTNALLLTATTRDGRQSRAAISYDAAASETYEASEDAELFLDSNLGDLPMVYTAAGKMAASINRTSGLYNIPVGVYASGAKGETVSLTFSGVDGFSYATLYDAETRTESPIHEGSRFTVPANTAGRYFLRAGVPTANEAVQESAIRIYTVGGGTLVVASTDLLRTVRVYDFAGRLVANETGLRTTQCRIELPEGSYIVKAESERGEEEVKIRM